MKTFRTIKSYLQYVLNVRISLNKNRLLVIATLKSGLMTISVTVSIKRSKIY